MLLLLLSLLLSLLLHLDSCHLCGSDIISNKLCVRCDDNSFCALNFILRREREVEDKGESQRK